MCLYTLFIDSLTSCYGYSFFILFFFFISEISAKQILSKQCTSQLEPNVFRCSKCRVFVLKFAKYFYRVNWSSTWISWWNTRYNTLSHTLVRSLKVGHSNINMPKIEHTRCWISVILISPFLFCLYLWVFFRPSQSNGDVIITGEGLQILTYVRHLHVWACMVIEQCFF